MIDSTTTNTVNAKRSFSKSEVVFAWFCILAGFLFCKSFPAFFFPLGGFMFLVLLYLFTTIILFIKKAQFSVYSVFVALSSLAVSSALVFSSNGFIHFLAFTYAFAAYCYFVYISGGNSVDKNVSDFIFVDFFKALFVMPFRSIIDVFKALWPKSNKGVFSLLGKVLLGIVVAIIPTVIVLSQLSYDSGFVTMFKKIFALDFVSVVTNLFSLIFGIPVGAFIYGAFMSSVDQRCKGVITRTGCSEMSYACKFVPGVTAISATIPILVLYVVFFISQWEYYLSAFTGVLPNTLSYAAYAREGFFQLCFVSLINLIIIFTLHLFMKRSGKSSVVSLRIISVIYSVFTLALISTAVSKMLLYINNKGLTQKRVYSTWFMLVVAVIFILVIIKQIFPRFKLGFASLFVSVILFSVLFVSNPDALIARYNVEQCLNGKFEVEDIESITKLGDSAVPYAAKIYEKTGDFEEFLINEKEAMKDDGIFRYTLPKIKAKRVLENLKID